jgi:hypothetical protein
VQYFFSGVIGPVKYLLGEATDDYGVADMTKGMFRKGHVKSLLHYVKITIVINEKF